MYQLVISENSSYSTTSIIIWDSSLLFRSKINKLSVYLQCSCRFHFIVLLEIQHKVLCPTKSHWNTFLKKELLAAHCCPLLGEIMVDTSRYSMCCMVNQVPCAQTLPDYYMIRKKVYYLAVRHVYISCQAMINESFVSLQNERNALGQKKPWVN